MPKITKILFISNRNWVGISDLKHYLQEYTVNNGGYPKVIEMSPVSISRFQRITIGNPDKNNLLFMGIPVREKRY